MPDLQPVTAPILLPPSEAHKESTALVPTNRGASVSAAVLGRSTSYSNDRYTWSINSDDTGIYQSQSLLQLASVGLTFAQNTSKQEAGFVQWQRSAQIAVAQYLLHVAMPLPTSGSLVSAYA